MKITDKRENFYQVEKEERYRVLKIRIRSITDILLSSITYL